MKTVTPRKKAKLFTVFWRCPECDSLQFNIDVPTRRTTVKCEKCGEETTIDSRKRRIKDLWAEKSDRRPRWRE